MDASARWSDAQLDAMRQTQDVVADPVVATLFAAGQVDAVNSLMKTLVENDGLPPDALPSVAAYLSTTGGLPDWADPDKIAAGERVLALWPRHHRGPDLLRAPLLLRRTQRRPGARPHRAPLAPTHAPHHRETAEMVVDVYGYPVGLGAVGSAYAPPRRCA